MLRSSLNENLVPEKPVASLPAKPTRKGARARYEEQRRRFPVLCLTALGIVYGDIGTSPIYAVRQCFSREHGGSVGVTPDPGNVLGILSLIFWALLLVVSIKYLLYVMRADNHGEGGILALFALLRRKANSSLVVILGIFGAALLYGDGMITPAISVLSAVEGLQIATSAFEPYVVPITIMILVALFLIQSRGTGGLGLVFGPVMLIWFATIALLGLISIARVPAVLAAVNPVYAVRFFAQHGWKGFIVLGAVFLVATGAEALYADIGHFGRRPIRATWFLFVLPALLLSYFGQGAMILRAPGNAAHPFFALAPGWMLYPFVLLATTATIIASQAVISGAFSLTRQAVLLDDFPRLRIVQTSAKEIGQIYIPSINWLLMVSTIGLVLGFRSSEKLAGAYGLAVSTTMFITTVLTAIVARRLWKWNPLLVGISTLAFLAVDLMFFGSNLLKFFSGGWFPLLVAAAMYLIMSTWKKGGATARRLAQKTEFSLSDFLKELEREKPKRPRGTSIFLTSRTNGVPGWLLHYVKRTHALTSNVLLLTVETHEVPHIPADERIEITKLADGLYRIILSYGFMDSADVPAALKNCRERELRFDPQEVTYFAERPRFIADDRSKSMMRWRKKLFASLTRNATRPIGLFNIPTDSAIELTLQVKL
jgi:KUP system potassium uptake protein